MNRRLATCAVVVGVACAGGPTLAAPAFAAQPSFSRTVSWGGQWLDRITRLEEVNFAERHWNWTAWNDSTPVTDGADQTDYQCAEFVARSMAAAGLIPGLGPDAPQSDYSQYTAPNGKVYDLLLISVLPQYNNIYDYLMDSGVGIDLGDDPADARPGDFVVTFLAPDGTSSHMGVVVTPAASANGVTVDAHNHARLRYAYVNYEPSHVIELTGNARARVDAWAAAARVPFGPSVSAGARTNGLRSRTPLKTGVPAARRFDPAGPQV